MNKGEIPWTFSASASSSCFSGSAYSLSGGSKDCEEGWVMFLFQLIGCLTALALAAYLLIALLKPEWFS